MYQIWPFLYNTRSPALFSLTTPSCLTGMSELAPTEAPSDLLDSHESHKPNDAHEAHDDLSAFTSAPPAFSEDDEGELEASESAGSLPPLEGLLPVATYDDVPDVEELLARLVTSTTALSKSFDATVKSSAAHIGEITEFMVGL